ncbi:hypothetical protein [Saccharopolyspora gregorii]|uniref:DUF2530 domain-containing protein n=1 Tax=Saccharopolyspora gregorii TaxID=33914 RepID=A0ABP6RHM9_9PSEU
MVATTSAHRTVAPPVGGRPRRRTRWGPVMWAVTIATATVADSWAPSPGLASAVLALVATGALTTWLAVRMLRGGAGPDDER